jgi:hypothetical protein
MVWRVEVWIFMEVGPQEVALLMVTEEEVFQVVFGRVVFPLFCSS